jgi:hypothetical protein
MDELLPCPFCGGKPATNTCRTSDREYMRLNGRDTGHGVNCIVCGVNNRGGIGVGYATPEKAIEAWNRRAALRTSSPAYDRELIARMLETGCPAYTDAARLEQVRLLRAADNAEASFITTGIRTSSPAPAEPVELPTQSEILDWLAHEHRANGTAWSMFSSAIDLITALTAAKAAQDGALSQIAGMEFYLHENPCDVADVEPARLVMAMSVGHQVFCHRASQGDNGICKPEVKAAPPESVKPCTDERACVNCYSGQGPCLIDGHAQPAPDGKGAAHG